MSTFERYLTLWVALCIIAGIALGHLMPGVFHAIGAAEIARVNLPVAALIWLMIVPMLIKIDFAGMVEFLKAQKITVQRIRLVFRSWSMRGLHLIKSVMSLC